MKARYTCTICGWSKISDNILDYNVHASNEHREKFYFKGWSGRDRRNGIRLRDFVEVKYL